MTAYSSAKDCLLKHGKIAAITRGRISADNHAFLASCIANGDTVNGYEAKESTKPTGEKAYSNAKPALTNEKVISDFTYRRSIDTPGHMFYGGKKFSVNMREICGHCRVSLVQCYCGVPEVVAPDGRMSVRVFIEGE